MNGSDLHGRSLTAERLGTALHEVGGVARPEYLDDIVTRAQGIRQRPAWSFPERWLPMSVAVRRQGIPRGAVLFAVLLLLLVAAFAATVMFTGSQTRGPAPLVVSNGEIAFASGNEIVAVRADGSARHVLVAGATPKEGISFSPDGTRMAYWSENGATSDLVVADADGSHQTTIAPGVIEPTGPPYAVWSPDGTTLAYSSRTQPSSTPSSCAGSGVQNGDFCTSRIFIAPVDGSGARQVGDTTLDARSPVWSPDGSTIAFGGGNATPGKDVHLYLMNADGSNVRQVSAVKGSDWAFQRIGWSPDGSEVAAQADAANGATEWDIWIIDAKTGAATDVGAQVGGGDEVLPAWAPDRNALAWLFNGLTVKESGAPPKTIRPIGGLPFWSPDGKLLLSNAEANKLEVVDMDGAVKFTVEGATSDSPSWEAIRSGR